MKTLLISLFFLTSLTQAEIHRFIELEKKTIYRGSQPQNQEDYQKLKKLGVKTIINLRWDTSVAKSKADAQLNRIQFYNFPIKAVDYPDGDQMEQIFQVLLDPKNHPVFFHCQHGKDRTGLIAALYRVHYQNWKPQAARNEWIQMGFAVHFLRNLDQFFTDHSY